jgi:branched-chain amino acid transport system ATP-binding protein
VSVAPSRGELRIEGLTVAFGGVKVLDDVSLTAAAGEVLAIIGPNGAGKTTLFNTITGVYGPQSGTVAFDGESLVGRRPSSIVRLGVARTFQNVALFGSMSVWDNLLVGCHHRMRSGIATSVFAPWRATREDRALTAELDELLSTFGLDDVRSAPVSDLPHGINKRVELVRAVAMRPRLLLLDEPTAGLNTQETAEFAEHLQVARRRLDVTIALIEHDMPFVLSLADRIHVLNFGRTVTSGPPAEVATDPRVIEAYLGTTEVAGR